MNTENVDCPLCRAPGTRSTIVASGIDYEYETSSEVFRFVACSDCGTTYLNPRPAISELSRIYPSNYYAFVGEDEGKGIVKVLRARWETGKVRDYLRYVGSARPKVLDVGCGRGRLLLSIQRAAPESELYGIELDAAAVEATRQLGFHATQATVEAYEQEERFDLILMQQVIEHVAAPRHVLRKLHSLLAPGGVLVLETPSLDGWDYRLFKSGIWGGYHFPRHWTLFTRQSLTRLAEEEGFELVDHTSLLSLSFWTWSIHNLMLRSGMPRWLVRIARPPNPVLLALTVPLEALQQLLGVASSNQRVAIRRRGLSGRL